MYQYNVIICKFQIFTIRFHTQPTHAYIYKMLSYLNIDTNRYLYNKLLDFTYIMMGYIEMMSFELCYVNDMYDATLWLLIDVFNSIFVILYQKSNETSIADIWFIFRNISIGIFVVLYVVYIISSDIVLYVLLQVLFNFRNGYKNYFQNLSIFIVIQVHD